MSKTTKTTTPKTFTSEQQAFARAWAEVLRTLDAASRASAALLASADQMSNEDIEAIAGGPKGREAVLSVANGMKWSLPAMAGELAGHAPLPVAVAGGLETVEQYQQFGVSVEAFLAREAEAMGLTLPSAGE